MRDRLFVVVASLVVVGAIAPVLGLGTAAADAGTAAQSDADCSFPVSHVDGMDENVTVEEAPETVVTLNPSAAQTMWEIGAEEQVVGVTKHAENLEGAGERTNISGGGETVNLEAVVELDPDLVLAPDSQVVTEEMVESLREAGLTVYLFPSAETIDDVREKTLRTGELVGECEGAVETVDWMDEELSVVESAVDGEERPDVLYTFFGFTAGSETFVHEILEAAGGTNVAAAAGIEEYEQANEEMVVEQDPEWIVLNSNSPEVPDGEAYESTTAVQQDQTIVVDVNHLNRPGPRIVHGVAALAEAFHPEAYAEARADAEADVEAGTDADAASSPTEASDDPEGQAGFGPTVALVGLLVATLAVLRARPPE